SYFTTSTRNLRHIHPFPTRRSSDLTQRGGRVNTRRRGATGRLGTGKLRRAALDRDNLPVRNFPVFLFRVFASSKELAAFHQQIKDRKSTRLNSSHQIISYAVFCLKK